MRIPIFVQVGRHILGVNDIVRIEETSTVHRSNTNQRVPLVAVHLTGGAVVKLSPAEGIVLATAIYELSRSGSVICTKGRVDEGE